VYTTVSYNVKLLSTNWYWKQQQKTKRLSRKWDWNQSKSNVLFPWL